MKSALQGPVGQNSGFRQRQEGFLPSRFWRCGALRVIFVAGKLPQNLKKHFAYVPTLFEGGWLGMSLLTVELICLLFAAWKAPAWVREIGLLALVTGVVYTLLGFRRRWAL